MLRGALLFALALSAGCFDAPVASCALSCTESTCPEGYECTAAGLCRLAGSADTCTSSRRDAGDEPLVDRGLIVRYFLDEAAGGTQPTHARDSAPAPLDLELRYGAGVATYAQDEAGNRGLHFAETEADASASVAVVGSKIWALNGSPTGTIEIVAMVSRASSNRSRLSHIGRDDQAGVFTLNTTGPESVGFALLDSTKATWSTGLDLRDRTVLHLVFDTRQPAAQRVLLYANGAPLSPNPSAPLPEGTVVELPDQNDTFYVLGNRYIGGRSFEGDLFYAAMYSEALTPQEVARNAGHLLAGDDE